MVDTETHEPVRRRRDAASWIASNPFQAITALGLLLYASLRFTYSMFYDPLGVSPEEIGLGYAEILSQSVVGTVLAIGIFLSGLGLLWLMTELFPGRITVTRWAPGALIAFFVLTMGIEAWGARVDARQVQEGQRPGSQGAIKLRIFSSRADVARVTFLGSDVDPPRATAGCLMYLGQANGISVFYDPEQGPVRIPSTAVTIVAKPERDSC